MKNGMWLLTSWAHNSNVEEDEQNKEDIEIEKEKNPELENNRGENWKEWSDRNGRIAVRRWDQRWSSWESRQYQGTGQNTILNKDENIVNTKSEG